MATPQIFVSSTYVDLKDIREGLAQFIRDYGFEPILFERGGIPFDYAKESELSCYDQVKRSDMYILIIGGRYGTPSRYTDKKITDGQVRRHMKAFNSITKNEYETARSEKIPTHVFVDARVMVAYETWKSNPNNPGITYPHVDNNSIFQLIAEVLKDPDGIFLSQFNGVGDILAWLKTQWAGQFKILLESRKQQMLRAEEINATSRVNAYKLFFHRRDQNMSLDQLAAKSGVPLKLVQQYERRNKKYKYHEQLFFPLCPVEHLEMLASALKIGTAELSAGNFDDHASQFVDFYIRYRGKEQSKVKPIADLPLFPAKVVVMDFDGTMTIRRDHLTSWEKIWVSLGYPVNECAKHLSQFRTSKISHAEWCSRTLEAFRAKGLKKDQVLDVAREIHLLPRVRETVEKLKLASIPLYILSGSINVIIESVLGDLRREFKEIRANRLEFDSSDVISDIVGTEYDFEGKAKFLRKTFDTHGVDPYDVVYIGNSGNDEWAWRSGARTLCVNPHFTNPYDGKKWRHQIRDMQQFDEVLPYILP